MEKDASRSSPADEGAVQAVPGLRLWLIWGGAHLFVAMAGVAIFLSTWVQLDHPGSGGGFWTDLAILLSVAAAWFGGGIAYVFLSGRVVRSHFAHSSDWWGVSFVGWLAPLMICGVNVSRQFGLWLDSLRAIGLAIPFFGLPTGIGLGVCQWLVLRRVTPRAIWWIPASAVGWAAGGAFSALLLSTRLFPLVSDPKLRIVPVLVVFPLAAGAIAGLALVWLARAAVPTNTSGEA